MRHQRSTTAPSRVSHNRLPTNPDGRGASTVTRKIPVGKDPLAVEHVSDIVEESEADRFYVHRGPADATAVRVIYLDNDWVFDEPTKEQSLVKAKQALRAYRAAHGLDDKFWPDERWATIAPVKL